MTLSDSLEQFLRDRQRRCTPRIVEWYASHLKLFASWLSEQDIRTLESITPDHIEQYIASLRERQCLNRKGKMSPTTIHKRATAIRTFFHWAYKLKLIENDLSESFTVPRIGKRLPKSLSSEQVTHLLATHMDSRERAAILLILDSGLRLSEAAKLEIEDIDLSLCVVHVQHGKGDKERFVVIGEDTRNAVRAWLDQRYASFGETAVFIGLQGPLTSMGLYKLIKRVAERAGVALHPHMLRHTFATSYLDGGGNIYDLSKLMGHTHIDTTTIYLSVSMKRLSEKHRTLSPVSRLGNGNGKRDMPTG